MSINYVVHIDEKHPAYCGRGRDGPITTSDSMLVTCKSCLDNIAAREMYDDMEKMEARIRARGKRALERATWVE